MEGREDEAMLGLSQTGGGWGWEVTVMGGRTPTVGSWLLTQAGALEGGVR